MSILCLDAWQKQMFTWVFRRFSSQLTGTGLSGSILHPGCASGFSMKEASNQEPPSPTISDVSHRTLRIYYLQLSICDINGICKYTIKQ